MKRIALLFIAAMLVASPALAAGKSETSVKAQSSSVNRAQGQAVQTNVMNETTVQGSTLANVGKNNTMDVGGVSNSGNGVQTNIMNETKIQGSTLANVGEGNEMRVGTVRQGK
ncbi:hypothetical protein [Desulfovibrio sp. ZJ200]|uniref:hypothetical protein n=1 Tax=Desulfovibrio sp. ZJ200 TaxID=2709792 RepID=UPI0013EBEFC6|nr:hypothetical protein [Desulfovibrio sp. ZJ200]